MATSRSAASLIVLTAVLATVFSLIETSLAADAPAPSPVSSASLTAPSFAAGCAIASIAAFLFGSAIKI